MKREVNDEAFKEFLELIAARDAYKNQIEQIKSEYVFEKNDARAQALRIQWHFLRIQQHDADKAIVEFIESFK